MDRADFHYDLPTELIAQVPLGQRSAGRLLVLCADDGNIRDGRFVDFTNLIDSQDLLIFNDTRVLPARLCGQKASGGRVEILLDRLTGTRGARVQIKASRSPVAGTEILLPGGAKARVGGREGRLFDIELDRDLSAYLEVHGEIPLPPYITRPAKADDEQRYQTVFARAAGAVAAPTAGLHFDQSTFAALRQRGIEHDFLTLHVGAGTFAPVNTEKIEEHSLHAEWAQVPESLCDRIAATKACGGRVIAVGTTTVRALETAVRDGELKPFSGDTDIFIYPGYRFRVVDALLTNFHLPESSLLMLVSAFAGSEHTLNAYRHAVEQRYRFFSYGDAMFFEKRHPTRAIEGQIDAL